MRPHEAQVWERCFQFWALIFCLTVLRYSTPASNFMMWDYAPSEPLIAGSTVWLVAGLLSTSFLCRLYRLGELDDLSRRQMNVRIAASIPLGVVALIHSLYQMQQRRLLQ